MPSTHTSSLASLFAASAGSAASLSSGAGSAPGALTERERFRMRLRKRPLLVDGAMGTLLFSRGVPQRSCLDELVLTRPELISTIHREYIEAGADVIETNTFSATSIAQADYGLQARAWDINFAAARIARECCDAWTARTPDKPRFVAGALGPTNRTASISPDVNDPGARNVTFDVLAAAYGEAVAGLAEGGADMILVETVFDTLNAKAALFAVETYFDRIGRRLPVIVSGTITDASGRTLSGQTPEAFWNAVRHVRPLAVGLNCALGAALMRPYIEEIARVADTFVSCYPNAGLPNPMSDTGYDETPAQTSRLLQDFAQSGFVNIVGGCCGTTPEHIRAIAEAVRTLPPRRVPAEEPTEAAA